jgi:magnesium chelatase family protein
MDILLSLKAVDLKEHEFTGIESSEKVKARVEAARERQYKRYGKPHSNGSVPFEQVMAASPLTRPQQRFLQMAVFDYGLSNRVEIKIIRLARTIADLRGAKAISDEDLVEAMGLRGLKAAVRIGR